MGLIEKIEAAQLKTDRPQIRPGQTVEVLVRVVEGDKERQQKFRGEVINVRGAGLRQSFTVRKISEGVGVERTFPVHGPAWPRSRSCVTRRSAAPSVLPPRQDG